MLLNCGAGEDSWRVRWTANQSILKEINPEYSLEGLLLKLKLQYFGHLMWRANSLEKTLMLEKIEDKRRRGQQQMRWLDGITVSMGMNFSKLRGTVEDRGAWCAAIYRVTKSRTVPPLALFIAMLPNAHLTWHSRMSLALSEWSHHHG